eukprot:TRINITY_DN1150_c0_g1_i2.p1 TRINITY_DN1150_c0_g1~~TRINITY_DN1150_c0_g1_i2.p1  ORF type:complete len:337 (-),score=71.26 TRINITY_DN1150_c0_g1_i2:291-1301(-)
MSFPRGGRHPSLRVDVRAARALLERHWRLPKRRGHARSPSKETDVTPASLSTGRDTTMGFRYVHRAVSHFYQRLCKKAVAALLSFVNDEENIGSVQRLRGTQTEYEVELSPTQASPLVADDAFMTEFSFRPAVLRALTVIFSTLGVLREFSEDGPVDEGRRAIACRTADVAFVTMKIRQHLKMRVRSSSGDHNGVAPAVSGLNPGHRAEWVEELSVVREVFLAQGYRACNGLRLTDGTDRRRADADYRPPQNAAASDAERDAPLGGAVEEHAEASAALAAWNAVDANDIDDVSNGDHDDDVEDLDAAVDAARAALGQSLEEESVDSARCVPLTKVR